MLDRHMNTIEKSINSTKFRYLDEYFEYTFSKDGHIEETDHPLTIEEMKPLTKKYGALKPDGLRVIKKEENNEKL